ncbi:MAG: hypothetical protein JO352_06535 [Chloroflexi bacterium]|nr:hypothetical protein [Chloroflexota bacterium]MBV9601298.1 hypothetical protein [Chloroflexota bacterium]
MQLTDPMPVAAIYYDDKMFEDSTASPYAGIAVVLYTNNRFEGQNAPSDLRIPMLAFVGQDEFTSGAKLAQAFLPHLPDGTTVLYVNPYPMFRTLAMGRDGIAQVLEPAGHPVQMLNLDSSGDEGEYLSVIGPYLQAHPEVGAVLSGTSASNPGGKPRPSHDETVDHFGIRCAYT